MNEAVPLHAFLVHIPVTLIVLASVCGVMALRWYKPFWRLSLAALGAAVPALLLAEKSGENDTGQIYERITQPEVQALLDQHAVWADRLLPLVICAIVLMIFASRLHKKGLTIVAALSPLPALILLIYTGDLGGSLVYEKEILNLHKKAPVTEKLKDPLAENNDAGSSPTTTNTGN